MIRVFHDSREQQDGTPPALETLTLVAEVQEDTTLPNNERLLDAIEVTRHPRVGAWRNHERVNPIMGITRSTEHGDVLERDGHFYQYFEYVRAGNKSTILMPLNKNYYAPLLSIPPKEEYYSMESSAGCGFKFDTL